MITLVPNADALFWTLLAALILSRAMWVFARAICFKERSFVPLLLKIPTVACLYFALSAHREAALGIGLGMLLLCALILSLALLARAGRLRYTQPLTEDTIPPSSQEAENKDWH